MSPRRRLRLAYASQRWEVILRLVWVLLFVIHLYPVFAVSVRFFKNPSLANIASLAALFGVLTLSALKALDIEWLRIALNRRSVLGLLMLAMWIHGDFVINRLPDLIPVEATVNLTVVLLAASVTRFARHLQVTLADRLAALLQTFRSRLDEVWIPPPVVIALQRISPRGPPRV